MNSDTRHYMLQNDERYVIEPVDHVYQPIMESFVVELQSVSVRILFFASIDHFSVFDNDETIL